jgi:type II secretory pathway component GspD/PulD (secretin)
VDVLKQYRRQNGVGWSINSSGPAGSTISSAASGNVGETRGPVSLSTVAGFAQGLNLYGAIGTAVNAYVQALQSTNRFQIVSRPSVFTQNNKKATILSGSREPVPSSTLTSLNNGANNASVTANITYENIDLRLEVVPLINASKEVTLDIYQTNDTLGSTRNIGGTSAVSINKQELKTTLTVANKTVIFLGGLVRDSKRKDQSGIPILSKIPVVGALFGGTSKSSAKTELVILLQPTVIESDDDLVDTDAAERERMIVFREAEKANQPQIKRAGMVPQTQSLLPDSDRP